MQGTLQHNQLNGSNNKNKSSITPYSEQSVRVVQYSLRPNYSSLYANKS